ncbi:MAG: DctP family TRAP transporter solute-binding subunit [Deltaproteobacteria bacterium]|nr:DctP family TRAP transporter solute-binding subunit [Deltaproteobacteria bacterium]
MNWNLSKLAKVLSVLVAFGLIFSPSFVSAASVTIKFAHVDPEDVFSSKKGAAARAFKDIVEAETSGDIAVNLFPAGQLGGEREIIEACKLGAVEVVMVSGAIAGYFKPAMVLDLPYLFSSPPVAWKVLDGPFGQELGAAILKETGLRNLAFGETGFRNFTNSKRMIKSPADLKGLKIRVMETPLYVTMVKGLGASPTPIAWPEVYTSLQMKVVDGQENPVGVILNNKIYEVQKYLTLDGHAYGADFMLINDKFFNKLSADQQKVVKTASIIAGNCGRSIQQLNSAMGVSKLKELGMEVYSPTPQERAQFKAATQGPVIDWMKTQIDPMWIDKVMNAVKQAEASL